MFLFGESLLPSLAALRASVLRSGVDTSRQTAPRVHGVV
jgi:hypothetical protein